VHRYKFIFSLLLGSTMLTAAYAQENSVNHLLKTVKGAVVSADSVGNTITIQKADQQQMTFLVPEKAIITQESQNIGLTDIGASSFVTIQYFVSPSLKNIVVSIVDNESVVNE